MDRRLAEIRRDESQEKAFRVWLAAEAAYDAKIVELFAADGGILKNLGALGDASDERERACDVYIFVMRAAERAFHDALLEGDS